MKKELLEFFKKHEQIALEFNRRLKDLADYLRSRTEKMADGVEVPGCFTIRGKYWSSLNPKDETSTSIYHTVYYETDLAGVTVRIETWISVNGVWQIEVWLPKGGEFSKVKKWFEDNRIRFLHQDGSTLIYAKFEDSVAEDEVRKKLQELLNAINVRAKSRAAVADEIALK